MDKYGSVILDINAWVSRKSETRTEFEIRVSRVRATVNGKDATGPRGLGPDAVIGRFWRDNDGQRAVESDPEVSPEQVALKAVMRLVDPVFPFGGYDLTEDHARRLLPVVLQAIRNSLEHFRAGLDASAPPWEFTAVTPFALEFPDKLRGHGPREAVREI